MIFTTSFLTNYAPLILDLWKYLNHRNSIFFSKLKKIIYLYVSASLIHSSNLLFPFLIYSVLCKSGYETSQYLLTNPQMTVYWFLCLDNKQEQSFVWEFLCLPFHLYKTNNEINILCRMVITHRNHKATFLLEHKKERDAITCILGQAVSPHHCIWYNKQCLMQWF